jgi:hypothetical protein
MKAMRPSRWLPLAVGLGAVLLNPGFGCGPDYQYGAEELRAAVEGTWQVAITAPDGTTTRLQIALEQGAQTASSARRTGALVREAAACGTRTLVKGAGACIDSTEMPLAGRVLSGDPGTGDWSVSGNLSVASLTFTTGSLSLAIGPQLLHGNLSSTGVVTNLRTTPGRETAPGTATMERIAR